ncbi:MAG TPA: DUF5060 domain-containing protein [Candidatus Binatia bacterium]
MLAVSFLRHVRLATLALGALVLAVVCGAPASDAAPPTVQRWARFEASWVPPVPPTNPFDPDEIDVRAEFVSPGGKLFEVLGFWYQDYERELRPNGNERLTPVGEPHFRVRFTPTRPGRWRWRWVVRQGGATTTTPFEILQVKPAKGRGFLRISRRDRRHLAFDDRSPYFAVGENTGWYDSRGTFAYDDWFARLAEQGANFARIWMAPWSFGLEWNDTPLGDYTNRLGRAWQLDHVLEEAERRGIYVMVSLINHGAFATLFNGNWASNPYNAANGGPLATADEFFTDPTARKLFERRLRYVVARWGWSTHVHSWELWNEVDLTDGYRSPAITQWHADMAALLRALDPYDHLVTSSHALYWNDRNVWLDGGLDFTQIHFYADQFPPFANIGQTVTTWTRERMGVTGKPVLFAEIGVDARGAPQTREADPEGIGIHDALWAGVVSGGIGTGMTWWWDNLIAQEPDRYYPMFGAVARFVEGLRWDRERFAPATATVQSQSRPVVAYGLRGRTRLLLWIKDDAFQWNAPQAVEIGDATLQVEGRWCGQWYDTWTGAWLDTVKLNGTVPVPPFSRDIALLAGRCPAKNLHR